MSKYGDVIADALQLYEAVMEDVLKGNEVLTRWDDGTEIPYRVIL
ncbi:MAG: hypothetical protein ACR2RA_03270 [Geminicoccaceae bacterium]